MRHTRIIERRLAGAIVLVGWLAACTGAPDDEGSGRAALLILHGDGTSASACIEFEGGSITGEDVLERSGFPTSVDALNPMGLLVCSIDGEGCTLPGDACLCACRGAGGCSYWAYFNRDRDGEWVYAVQGARGRVLQDGDADAWVWLDRALPGDQLPIPPPESGFESICG